MNNTSRAAGAVAAGLALLCAGGGAQAQSITVLPVNLNLAAGEQTSSLTVINQGAADTSVQIRVLAWSQANGVETLTPSDEVMASPPIATIAAGATQVVRLVLRKAPTEHEATYRILLDQIPAPATPGTVRIALRLSIPVFAEPATRALPRVAYHVESGAGKAFLVAVNEGERHETTRDLALATSGGAGLTLGNQASPYILSGVTQRWPITAPSGAVKPGGTLRLTGQGDTGAIDESVSVTAIQ